MNTPDNMGRPVRADEPLTRTEYINCPDCGVEFDKELFPKVRGCWEHEDDLSELRERAYELWEEKEQLTVALRLRDALIKNIEQLEELRKS